MYDVEVDTEDFALGEGVTDAQYVDISELEHSEDIFEKMVYSVATDVWLLITSVSGW